MASQERSVLVLYGSETGNAQDIAEELGRLCQRLHFESHVSELDATDLTALLQHQLVIFVISTTGQGDMPHNSLLFWKKLLRKKLPPNCLSRLKYTCFGLGDSTYLKFNWAARKLVRRLDQLGAATFIDAYEADEQFPDGIDGSFVRWAEDLKKHLLEHYPPPSGLEPIPDDTILPPRWSLAPALNALSEKIQEVNVSSLSIDQTNATLTEPNLPPPGLLPIPAGWTATLTKNERLTPQEHWQDNFPHDVQKLIDLMDWNDIADRPLDLSACPSLPHNLYAPASCTLRDLLLNNIDITAIPRRSFLKNMSYFSSDEYHRERLLEFNMPEYMDEYFDYATRSRRSIIEVLDEFTSVKIPAERLLDVFPLIRGRDFSIANGGTSAIHPSKAGATRVDLLVAMVKYRTVLRKPREGLCSRYLASLLPGATLRVSYKAVLSPIHGAANAQRPLIAMATGTGVAPVRCLVHERLTHPSPAPMIIFFGNRNSAADYFFEAEWRALAEDAAKKNSQLLVFTAFSRDQREKIYVQDLVRREAPRLEELIPQKAIFAVCGGSTRMADACKRAVFDPFTENGDEEARKEMLGAITWWQEIW
ncbi:flavodoxin domain-containing protein [Trichoderma breve]|uniref:Flavodoxin domain-containing protein n=1 Tax=Trichoderma breve TaxID=2034170 RepID=A0A9W9EDF8_9HYPO|nr:flavodoxin domain-containing protein [Trichoderma breve]KAJ4864619.1 flavodoxin domain-containing protein [Trichoderma breve]